MTLKSISLLMFLWCASASAWADADTPPGPSTPAPVGAPASAMLLDLVIVRPLSLVATVAGTGVFIIGLPFSALGGNVAESGRVLVVKPAAYTFQRPLGYYDDTQQ